MKKFFKKIGRGFKKLGRGIKKIFSSKIGRILGTIMLAVALPAMFNAFYTGGVTTGAGADLAVSIPGTAGEGVTQVTASAVKAAHDTGNAIKIANAADKVKWSQRFAAMSEQTGQLFKNPMQALERTVDSMLGTTPTLLTAEEVTSYQTALGQGKGIGHLATSKSGAITDSSSLIDDFNKKDANVTEVVDNFIDSYRGQFEKASQASDTFLEDFTDLTQSQKNLHLLVKNSAPNVQSDLFSNPKFREMWSTTAEQTQLGSVFKPPASFKGVAPYPDIKTAWTEGKGIHKAGRTVDQIASTRFKDVLPFGYEGLGAQSSVVSVGQNVAAGASLLMPDEPQEVAQAYYNPVAAQQATASLEQARTLGAIPTSEPIDMNDILRDYSTDVDAMSVYKGILHKNQMGMGYGPYALT